MIRGTSATFKFEIPYDFNDVQYINIVFWQDGNNGPSADRLLPITKIKTDCTWSATNKQVVVRLTPEETARFMDDRKAKAQLNGTTFSGIRFANKEYLITVYPNKHDSVLGDIVPPSNLDDFFVLDGGHITE